MVRLSLFDLTVDAYKIDIDDQIVLSELINRTFSTQVANLLDPLGVQAARFFSTVSRPLPRALMSLLTIGNRLMTSATSTSQWRRTSMTYRSTACRPRPRC